MLRHVVLFRWRAEVAESEKRAVETALGALPAQIPEIRSYEFGPDAALAPGNFDFALLADFESRADFETYQEHPRHQEVIRDAIRPAISERVAAQFFLRPPEARGAGR